MKIYEKINCLLLGTLWTLAIVLVLDFWLNTAYNFNMFSHAHWQYVANLQANNRPIVTGFYIAIAAAISLTIFGIFMLWRPRFRKIIFSQPANNTSEQTTSQPIVNNTPQPQPTQTITLQPTIQRPPFLHIQVPKAPAHPITQPIKKETPVTKPTNTNVAQYKQESREIFEKANYKVLTPKTIKNIPLSLIALGNQETLWIGAANISHNQMADIILAFQNIFQETLENIAIDINAFIINPTDDVQLDAILDFKNTDDLAAAISSLPNEPESDIDKESGNMDAFAGYIETVLTYLETN